MFPDKLFPVDEFDTIGFGDLVWMKTFCVWPEFVEVVCCWWLSLLDDCCCCCGTTFAIGKTVVDDVLFVPLTICGTVDDDVDGGIVVTDPENELVPLDVMVNGTTVAEAGTFWLPIICCKSRLIFLR